jgi:hypothetical protein
MANLGPIGGCPSDSIDIDVRLFFGAPYGWEQIGPVIGGNWDFTITVTNVIGPTYGYLAISELGGRLEAQNPDVIPPTPILVGTFDLADPPVSPQEETFFIDPLVGGLSFPCICGPWLVFTIVRYPGLAWDMLLHVHGDLIASP